MVRVVLCDDHRVLADGLASVLSAAGDFDVVGIAGNVEEVTFLAAYSQPDVVLMDYDLPDGDGIEATRSLRSVSPGTRVVMLTAYHDDTLLARAITEGCVGFLGKQGASGEVVDVLRRAAGGEMIFPPELVAEVMERAANPAEWMRLSKRELEVLRLLAEGCSNAAVGDRLGISALTVRNHVGAVLRKLGVRSRLEAVVEAAHLGLVHR